MIWGKSGPEFLFARGRNPFFASALRRRIAFAARSSAKFSRSSLLGRLRAAPMAFGAAALALLAPLPNIPGLDAIADGRALSLVAAGGLLVVAFLFSGRER